MGFFRGMSNRGGVTEICRNMVPPAVGTSGQLTRPFSTMGSPGAWAFAGTARPQKKAVTSMSFGMVFMESSGLFE
jgi:hypothetical protein